MNPTETEEPRGAIELSVRRTRGGTVETAHDYVGQEWPVALVFNGISHAVMMCTPRDLEAFAVGFAISEGIVERGSDIKDIDVILHADAPLPHAEVHLEVVQQAFAALKDRRRALAGRTGCGVCGIESIDLLDLAPERVPDTGFLARLAPDALARAAHALPAHQALTRLTGGLHAAGLFQVDGTLSGVCEDIGRHNAVDKVIGRALLQDQMPLSSAVLVVSGRGGFEIIQKAIAAEIPVVASVSAPSSLAVQLAREFNQTLIGFLRGRRFIVYSGEHRIQPSRASNL